MNTKNKIGFIGVGHMGGAMAKRVIATGAAVTVYDRDAVRATHFSDSARIADSAIDVAAECDIVFACLPLASASLSVARDVAKSRGALKIYVECSTIGERSMVEIANLLGSNGIATIDAPVSGGKVNAQTGTLTTILSGDPSVIAQVRPIFDLMANGVVVVGDTPGRAQLCKLINNALSLTALLATSEAMVAGVKAGFSPEILLEVINASSGRNTATVDKFPRCILPRRFDLGGPIAVAEKDLNLYVDFLHEIGAPSPIGEHLSHLMHQIVEMGDPSRDGTRAIEAFEEWAGVEVRGREFPAADT